MAKIPDATALGPRPTPSTGGPVYRLPNPDLTAEGMGLASAGGMVRQGADDLYRRVEIDREKQDTLRAEEALNELRKQQLELTMGEGVGFVHRRGSEAVNGDLFKEFDDKLREKAKLIESQLATPEQKNKFRARADMVGLQFNENLLRHITGERRAYGKQVLDTTLDIEVTAATSQWNDPNAIALSLTRVKDAIGKYAQQEGWSPEASQAALLAAESKVHAGVLKQMIANNAFAPAADYLKAHRESVDATTAAGVQKAVEDGRQKQLANGYQSIFLQVQNDGRSLKLLEKRISDDTTLDEGRKNILLARIGSRQDILERRAQAAYDRQVRTLGRTIDQLNADTLAGFEQPTERLLQVLSSAKGTELEGDARRALALSEATGRFRLSTFGQQEAAITQAETALRADPSKFDRRVLAAWKTIHADQRRQVREDPITFAARQGLVETKPLDLAKPGELGPALAERASIARSMRGTYQAPLKVLTTEEAGQLTSFLSRASVDQKQEYFAGLAKATTGDRETYRSIMGQIAPDDPVTAIAGVSANRGHQDRAGKAVSSMILRGQEILNPPKKEDGKPVGGKPMPLPPQKDLDSVFSSVERDAFAGMPRARADYYQTSLAIYAAKSAEAGDYSGVLDRGRWKESINLATGGIDTYRGKAVILPWGKSYGEFKTGIRDQARAFETAGRLGEGMSASKLADLPVEPIGDGRYIFRTGNGAVVDKDGRPLVVDFNEQRMLLPGGGLAVDAIPGPRYGTRQDGTQKGDGYYGPLKAAGGGVSTEITVGVNIDGKEMEIPTMVPGLTRAELNHLLAGKKPTDAIVRKAEEHAKKRIKEGKSPFAEPGERIAQP